MKLSAALLSDFIRAESGIESAVFDTRYTVAYSAVSHLLSSNNKTQWNMVTTACALYASAKECAVSLADPVSGKVPAVSASAVKKMNAVYLAYGAAIDSLTLPAFFKGRAASDIDTIASDAALQVATMVTGALQVAPKAPVTEDQKAEKLKVKTEKEAKAKAEVEQTIRTEAERMANASVVTLADMVRIVANALTQGMLDDNSYDVLAVACTDYTERAQAEELAQLVGTPVVAESAHA